MPDVTMQSGIYALISKNNSEKKYIGSAVNLVSRRKRHLRELATNKHFNAKLQNYYNKYGSDCFEFHVIQHVSPEYLISCEQFHIDAQKPYFNINPNASSRLGSNHSLKSKSRIKESCKCRKPVSMLAHLWHRVDKLQL